ncbi:MAG: type IV secretion system DNA-binding domain-containing protein [Patescibacteria group bacterium]|jgi:CxxC-x17-CxxC domain-containing protein
MSSNDITLFGITTFRNKNRAFGIKLDDRRRHMYVIGKTGMGKSTLLENMIVGDIRAGRGVAVVDPHGDLAEKVIDFIPSDRINDVIYFNPSDMEFPIAFNILERVEPHLRHLVASGLIGVFQKLWADSWGPRLEYILRNTILAVLDYPGATLLAVTRMLSDKDFRKKVVDKTLDPVVKTFWTKEFAGYADKFASEAVSPIQNKVGQFLSSSLIRNIIGQVKSSIDVRKIMDEGKILIMNLSKGRIGEDNSALLGSMMITKIQLAAMSRVDVPEAERHDFYLYVDEFQNFATDSFANILSEARKYHLNLIMGHQYVEQLGDVVKAAVFGNVGTLVVFRVGAIDAEELVKEFTPTFTEEDLVNLPKYEMYLKLMIDGVSSDPFSARGLPPIGEEIKTDSAEKVIKVSRERYARKKDEVEEKIMKWHAIDEVINKAPDKTGARNASAGKNAPSGKNAGQGKEGGKKDKKTFTALASKASETRGKIYSKPDDKLRSVPVALRQPADMENKSDNEPFIVSSREDMEIKKALEGKPGDSETYKYEAVCSRCAGAARISFPPDGIRPIFCKNCLTEIKKEKVSEMEERKKNKREELEKLARKELEKEKARSARRTGGDSPSREKNVLDGNKTEAEKKSLFTNKEFEKDWKEISLSELASFVPVKFGDLKKEKVNDEKGGNGAKNMVPGKPVKIGL